MVSSAFISAQIIKFTPCGKHPQVLWVIRRYSRGSPEIDTQNLQIKVSSNLPVGLGVRGVSGGPSVDPRR